MLRSSVLVLTVTFCPRSITDTTACSFITSLLILVEFELFKRIGLIWVFYFVSMCSVSSRPSPSLSSPHLILLSHCSVVFFIGSLLYAVHPCCTEGSTVHVFIRMLHSITFVLLNQPSRLRRCVYYAMPIGGLVPGVVDPQLPHFRACWRRVLLFPCLLLLLVWDQRSVFARLGLHVSLSLLTSAFVELLPLWLPRMLVRS